MADDGEPNPRTPSSDHEAMCGFWRMIDAILGGAEKMRATGQTSVSGPAQPYATLAQLNRGQYLPESPYLPRFPNETNLDYECRRKNAPFTNIYADISNNLASKPFSKTCELAEESGEDLKDLAENIDGLGNNLHVYARSKFKSALDKGITWTLVDYTKVPPNSTLAAEREMGARPYWVHLPAERVIAVYSKFLNGREIIFHARIDETCTELDGYVEVQYERVRVLNRTPMVDAATGNITGYSPATWQIWELVTTTGEDGKEKKTWTLKETGPITIGIIPLVPFIIGKRNGTSWTIEPALRDHAYMQINEFQQESNLQSVKELTANPMLTGNGIPGTDEKGEKIVVPVGPRAVLFAPPDANGNHGEWNYIGAPADCLSFLETSLEKLRTEMRDLGMQPLTASNLTVITTANVSMKAHSAVQAWALGLKDQLEQCWKITVMWLNQKVEPVVNVHVDFGVELEGGKNVEAVLKAEGQGIISKYEAATELKRFNVLRDDYDWDDDQEQIAGQQQGLEGEQPIDPRTGLPLEVDPLTGRPVAAPPKLVKA